MARFEQQRVLQSIANPRTGEAQGTLAVADTLQAFGKWGMEQYKQMRVQSAEEEALAVEPSAQAPALRSDMTLTGQAYNKIVLAGHTAAVKNDYTKRIVELQAQYEKDPQGFVNAATAYKAEMLNQVAPELRPAISTDYDRSVIAPEATIRNNVMRESEAEALNQVIAAAAIVAKDLGIAARNGDLAGMEHQIALGDGFVEALNSLGAYGEARKLEQLTKTRVDEQMVLGQFDRAQDKNAFIRNFMTNPPADLDRELVDKLSGEMTALRNRLESTKATTSESTKRKFGDGLNDYISFLESGGEDTLDNVDLYSYDNLAAIYGEEAATDMMSEIADIREFNRDLRAVSMATPEETRQILEDARPTSSSQFRREQGQFDRLVGAVTKRNEMLAEDPAKFVSANDEAVASQLEALPQAIASGDTAAVYDYATRLRTSQERLGIPPNSVTLLPAEMAKTLGQQINDMSGGGEQAVNTINALRDTFGSEWNTVLRQLSAQGELGQTAKIITMVSDPNNQAVVAEALINRKTYEDAIAPDVVKDIKDYSRDTVEPLQETLRAGYGDSGVKTANMVRNAVEATAARLIFEGIETDYDDALDKSFEMMFGDTEFMDTYRIPTAEEPDRVVAGVDRTIELIKMGNFDIYTPPSAVVANAEDAAAVFRQALSIMPITTLDGSGVAFLDQQGTPLLKPDGRVLEMTWEQLRNASNMTPEEANPLPTGRAY